MTDILLLICCIFVGLLLGLFLQRRERERSEFVKDLSNYVDLLRLNLDTKRRPIKEINKEFGEKCGKAFRAYLTDPTANIPTDKQLRADVVAFTQGLSCGSSAELAKHLDYYGKMFAELADKAEKEGKSKSGLFVKLGLLLGAMVGILFM